MGVEEQLIHRDEVVAMLFNVSDMVESLQRIEVLLGGGDEDEEGEADEG